jgi:hypothetical protein
MSTKLIITERQLDVIKKHLNENDAHSHLVEKLVKDLNANYEPMLGIVREEGEYFEEPMIKVKVDEESITPKELYEYFKRKYKLGDEFTKQVIRDWMFGTIKGNKLSKNVAIN